MGTLAHCVTAAQNKPYANRSNKRGEQLAAASAAAASSRSRKAKDVLPRPDSGVVMTDDGSDESSSVMGGMAMPINSCFKVQGQQRNSNLSTTSTSTMPNASASIAPAQPTPGGFDTFSMPPNSTSAPMTTAVTSASIGPADVQAWTQGVMYQPLHGMPDGNFGVHPNLNMQQDLPWSQSFYNPHAGSQGMDEDFSGYL